MSLKRISKQDLGCILYIFVPIVLAALFVGVSMNAHAHLPEQITVHWEVPEEYRSTVLEATYHRNDLSNVDADFFGNSEPFILAPDEFDVLLMSLECSTNRLTSCRLRFFGVESSSLRYVLVVDIKGKVLTEGAKFWYNLRNPYELSSLSVQEDGTLLTTHDLENRSLGNYIFVFVGLLLLLWVCLGGVLLLTVDDPSP